MGTILGVEEMGSWFEEKEDELNRVQSFCKTLLIAEHLHGEGKFWWPRTVLYFVHVARQILTRESNVVISGLSGVRQFPYTNGLLLQGDFAQKLEHHSPWVSPLWGWLWSEEAGGGLSLFNRDDSTYVEYGFLEEYLGASEYVQLGLYWDLVDLLLRDDESHTTSREYDPPLLLSKTSYQPLLAFSLPKGEVRLTHADINLNGPAYALTNSTDSDLVLNLREGVRYTERRQ